MEYFAPNERYYKKNLNNFTSSDEFVANKRVHSNNEMPPIDLYDMVHSKMKNDMWKWFLGSSSISYDQEYYIAPKDPKDPLYGTEDGVEYFDEDGIVIVPSITKYVNGVRAKDYGPVPYYNYTKNGIELINPEYHRIEIQGCLLPEIDFMLHEGYRYLNVLYPDHPDYTEILTTNEINDEIIHAGSLIHYNPDCLFFDWIVTELNSDLEDMDEETRANQEEALKMKVRNLTNHAFRRKLYGAKSGYLQFGSEIFQHVAVHPVAQYLPILPYERENNVIKNLNASKKLRWFSDLDPKPDTIDDRSVNQFHNLFRKQFRLIDWDNSSYDYLNEYQPPVKVHGTAYPTPFSLNDLYEYPISRYPHRTPTTMFNDFYAGQKIYLNTINENGQAETISSYINYIIKENAYKVRIDLEYLEKPSGLELNKTESITDPIIDLITKVKIDKNLNPIFMSFRITDSLENLIKNTTFTDKFFNDAVGEPNALTTIYKEFLKSSNIKEGKFTLNPYQDGTLYMSANQFLTLYQDELNINIKTIEYDQETGVPEHRVIEYGPISIPDDGYVNERNIISYTKNSELFASEIVGIGSGELKVKINNIVKIDFNRMRALIDNSTDEPVGTPGRKLAEHYGLVMEFGKNNSPDYVGKKVVFFGKFEPLVEDNFGGPDNRSMYNLNNFIFYIDAIPRVKDSMMLDAIYSDFSGLATQKFKDLVSLFRSGTTGRVGSPKYVDHYAAWNNCDTNFKLLIPIYNGILSDITTYNTNSTSSLQRIQNIFSRDLDIYQSLRIRQRGLETLYNEFLGVSLSTEAIRDKQLVELQKFYGTFVTASNRFLHEYTGSDLNQINRILERMSITLRNLRLTSILDETDKFKEIKISFENDKELLKNLNINLLNPILEISEEIITFSNDIISEKEFIDEEFLQITESLRLNIRGFIDENITSDISAFDQFISIVKNNYDKLLKRLSDEKDSEVNKILLERIISVIVKIITEMDFIRAEKFNLDGFNSRFNSFRTSFQNQLNIIIPFFNNDTHRTNAYSNEPGVLIDIVTSFRNGSTNQDLINSNPVILAYFNELIAETTNLQNLIKTFLGKAASAFTESMRLAEIIASNYSKLAPEKFKKLSIFNTRLNNLTQIIKEDEIVKNLNEIIDIYEEYNTVYFKWLALELAADLNTSYYRNLGGLTSEERLIYNNILRTDNILADYLPNRGFLLKPLNQENIYMTTSSDKESSYSILENRDNFLNILSISLDNYDEMVIYKNEAYYGKEGVIEEYSMGSLNTVSIINNDKDVDTVPEENFSCLQKEFLEIYDYSPTLKYKALNRDIYIAIDRSFDPRKFAYATPQFLEIFLPDDKINNIMGEVGQTHKVEIRSICVADSDVISFIDSESMYRMQSLSTGDQVIGPTIENDTFIMEINSEKNCITLNKKLNTSVDIVLTYLCKLNIFAKDNSKQFFKYRKELSRNSVIDSGSMIKHILQGQWPSLTFVNSTIDVSKFKDNLTKNLKKATDYTRFFNEHVVDLYAKNINLADNYVMPSIINANNNLYYELTAHRTYKELDRLKQRELNSPQGIFNFNRGREYIMKKEILDYFQNYVGEISRASDEVSIGVNINAFTYTNGVATRDNNIDSSFRTYGWNSRTMPYYVDIGIGKLSDDIFRKKDLEAQYESMEPKAYWNYDVYDNTDISSMTNEELKARGLDPSKIERSTYFVKEFDVNDERAYDPIYSIHKPIMRVYLGEYEVQKNIDFDGYLNRVFTTVQFSIIKQVFKDLSKMNEEDINILNRRFFELDLFKNIANNNRFIGDVEIIKPEQTSVFSYKGIWIPKSVKCENDYIIGYPPAPEFLDANYYYVITENTNLTNVIDMQKCPTPLDERLGTNYTIDGREIANFSYKAGTILLYNNFNNKWEIKDFIFNGLYGLQSELNKIVLPPPGDEETRVTIGNSIIPGVMFNDKTLLHKLLVKTIMNLGIIKSSEQNLALYSENELTKIYLNVINGTEITISDLDNNPSQEKIDAFPINFNNIYNINEHDILWFNYTCGYDKYNGQDHFNKCFIGNGQNMGLVLINNKFNLIFINTNKMFFLIDHSYRMATIRNFEYLTFVGRYGYTKDKNIFPIEIINKYKNKIDLGYKNILRGTTDIKFSVIPKFKVKGYFYDENDEIDYNEDISYYYKLGTDGQRTDIKFDPEKEVEDEDGNIIKVDLEEWENLNDIAKEEIRHFLDITEDKIYYDKNYDTLYSYNTINNERKKFAIDQQNNKYFKNLLYIYGQYQKIEAMVDGVVADQAVISGIEGIRFNSNDLSLFDRILQIEQVNVRSPYNVNLESVLFSNYCNIEGLFKGIYIDFANNKQYLSVNYKYDREPIHTSNKMKFLTEIQKLQPVKIINNESILYPENEINFGESRWQDGSLIYTPNIRDMRITKSLTDGMNTFIYFRNLLVLEGEIDISEPSKIYFNNNPKLGDALTYVRKNDDIKDLISISSSTFNDYKTYEFSGEVATTPSDIKFMDYRRGILFVIDQQDKIFYYKTPLLRIPDRLELTGENRLPGASFTLTETGTNNIYSANSLSWDLKKNLWIIGAYKKEAVTNQQDFPVIFSVRIDPIDASDYKLERIYAAPFEGGDLNTYESIQIRDNYVGDERHDNLIKNYKNVITRDVAFSEISYVEPAQAITWSGTGSQTPHDRDAGPQKQSFIISGTGNGTNNISVRRDFNITGIGLDNYKVIDFSFKKVATTQETSISFGILNRLSTNGTDQVHQVWIYNHSLQRWIVSENPILSTNFITNNTNLEETKVTTYVVGHNFGRFSKDSHTDIYNSLIAGQFLWKLPRAEISQNINIAAIVLAPGVTSARFEINIAQATPNCYHIYDFSVKDPKRILTHNIPEYGTTNTITNVPQFYTEGPYQILTGNDNENRAKKWTAYNSLNNQVIISGRDIFFYTKTNCYISKDLKNPTTDGRERALLPNGLTDNYHWKRARLPSSINVTYKLFDELNLSQAYRFVKLQRDIYLKYLGNRSGDAQTIKAWITANDVLEFPVEDNIPREITLNGIEFHHTENGKIPNFRTAAITKWSSPQETFYELGYTVSKYMVKQNYIRYLMDYYSAICSGERVDYFFNHDTIKDVTLTNTQLIIQTNKDDIITFPLEKATSRDNIENYNNWNITNLGTNYVYGLTSTNIKTQTVGFGNQYRPFGVYPSGNVAKYFTIMGKYINDNFQIYSGYISAPISECNRLNDTEDGRIERETLINFLPSDGTRIVSNKYPVVFFSDNEGKTFYEVNIPTTGAIPSLNAIGSLNIFADSIYRTGNEIRIMFKSGTNNGSSDLGFMTLMLVGDSIINDGQLKNMSNVKLGDLKATWKNFRLENYNGVLCNGYLNSDNLEISYSKKFCLELPFNFNIERGTRITKVGDDIIEYVSSVTPANSSEFVHVLVSIESSNLIENPTRFLEFKNEYLDSNGDFLVRSFIKVDDPKFANRLYSPRENLTPELRLEDKRGIPAISEDTNRYTYEYDTFVDANNEEVHNYRESLNYENQPIYLCDIKGDYMRMLDPWYHQDTNFTMKDLITENIDYRTLLRAPLLKSDYKPEENQDDFQILMAEIDVKQIHNLNFNRNNPDLQIDVNNDISKVINFLIDNNLLYEWPTEDNQIITASQMDRDTDDPQLNPYRIRRKELNPIKINQSFIDLVSDIERKDGPFGPYYKKNLSMRFAPYLYNNKYYVLDTSNSTLFIKGNINFYLNISMPYEFNSEQTSFYNENFNFFEDIILPVEEGLEINGIYIKPKGYGGSLLNKNFVLERPEHIDHHAFKRKLVKNRFDEYVYLTDKYGNKMNSKNGLFWLNPHEDTKFDYGNLIKKENKIKFYKTEEEYEKNNFVEYNLYKLESAPLNIYTPKKTVYLYRDITRDQLNEDKIMLTLMRLSKAGISISSTKIRDFYNIEFMDFLDNSIEGFEYDIENQQVLFNCKDFNIPSIENNKLFIHVTDENNKLTTHELDVSYLKEIGKIVDIDVIDFNREEFFGNNIANIKFDGRTISRNIVLSSIDFSLISFSDSIRVDSYGIPEDLTISIPMINYEQSLRNLRITNNNENFNLDIRNYELEILTNKDWIIGNSIRYEVYSKDQLYTGQKYMIMNDNMMSVIMNGNTIIKKLNVVTAIPFEIDYFTTGKYIFTRIPNELKEILTHTTPILIDGLFGNVLFNKPTFENFKELTDVKGSIIEFKERIILGEYKGKDINEISYIANDFSRFNLFNLIGEKEDKLNDGENHFIRMKLLPLNTIYPQIKYLNNPDYVQEVSYLETKLFGFDRIFINTEIYPPPPVTIRNVIYNNNSLPMYLNNNWTNKDGFKIFLSDENGIFIKPWVQNGQIQWSPVGNEYGDCRNEIYGTTDPRLNLLEPLYKTTIDWFKSEYYIEGKEINPFVININIKDNYDEKFKDFITSLSLTVPTKQGDNFIQMPVTNSYLSDIDNSIQYEYNFIENKLIQKSSIEIIDHTEGIINFIVNGPPDDYQYDKYKFLYGIKYLNSFYGISGEYGDIWSSKIELQNKINLSFYLNTKENVLDKRDREYGVVDITEMGLFNRRGELVAYLTHPIAQYRSNLNHISYSLLLEEIA